MIPRKTDNEEAKRPHSIHFRVSLRRLFILEIFIYYATKLVILIFSNFFVYHFFQKTKFLKEIPSKEFSPTPKEWKLNGGDISSGIVRGVSVESTLKKKYVDKGNRKTS